MPNIKEQVEIICPKCKHTEIIYLQKEDIPKCPNCDTRMVMREFLREGKSY